MHRIKTSINSLGHKLMLMAAALLMAGFWGNVPAFGDGPTIKINDIDSHQVNVMQGAENQLNVTLTPGASNGANADWWLVAVVNDYMFCFTLNRGWVLVTDNPSTVLQRTLFDVPATTVLDTAVLPNGAYTFYFAVDRVMDGILQREPGILSYDYVQLSVGLNANGFWENPLNGATAAGNMYQDNAGIITGGLLLPPSGFGHLTGIVNGSHMTFTMNWDNGGSESGSGEFSYVNTSNDKFIFTGHLPSVGNFEISWRGPSFEEHTPAGVPLTYVPPAALW